MTDQTRTFKLGDIATGMANVYATIDRSGYPAEDMIGHIHQPNGNVTVDGTNRPVSGAWTIMDATKEQVDALDIDLAEHKIVGFASRFHRDRSVSRHDGSPVFRTRTAAAQFVDYMYRNR